MTTVLVFGVFDGLHSGHLFFLKQAKKMGNKLIVAVAADIVIKKLKDRSPRMNEKERLELVKSLRIVDDAAIGDRKISSYNIVKHVKPNIICLGYDQKRLSKDIKKKLPDIKLKTVGGYKDKIMHSSIMKTYVGYKINPRKSGEN